MRIILLGPPGAGKGTQAKMLAQKTHLTHISTGDILRQNVSSDTDLGRKAKGFMASGALVPDELITSMLIKSLEQPDVKNGFILDGYPRSLRQAELLDGILKAKNMGIDLVVYLDTSEPVIVQRLSGRLVCQDCGANFHLKNMPPRVKMVCDNCGGKLYQRNDDREETIKKRLAVYKKEVSGIIAYYQNNGKYFKLSADEELETVLNKILELIRQYDDSLKV